MFKTLVAEVDGTLTVWVLPVATSLDLKALAAAVDGKRAKMADVTAAERATGYVAGGMSALGQKKRQISVERGMARSLCMRFIHPSGEEALFTPAPREPIMSS